MAEATGRKTWQFDTDNDHLHGTRDENQRQTMLNMKNVMIGFASSPWVVEFSCDSVTAGTAGDKIDRWQDISDLVHESGANPHSWIVLSQAGMGGLELCIDFNGGFFDNENWTLIVSVADGFTGGATTARPTATDEFVWQDLRTYIADADGDDAVLVHGMMTDDGSTTRLITVTEGRISRYFALETLNDPVDNWNYPYVFVNFLDLTYNRMTDPSAANHEGATAYFANDKITQWDPLSMEHYRTQAISENSSFANSSKNDLDGKFAMHPVGFYCQRPPMRGRHGEFFDLFFAPEALGSGESLPTTSDVGDWAVFGSLIFPWNNTPVRLG